FKWIPHPVRDDDGVVGGAVEQGRPGAAAGEPHDTYSNDTNSNSNMLLALILHRATSDEVSLFLHSYKPTLSSSHIYFE
ncbi:hypothetical protein CWC00_22300, partial [Pseudoalteromonas rubra]